MPVLFVYGMPEGIDGLQVLTEEFCRSVEAIIDFEIARTDVSVFYPADLMKEGRGQELVLVVDGFFALPRRTFQLRSDWTNLLRDLLAEFAQKNIPHCRKVEVFVRLFDPNFNTFAEWKNPQLE
jgi:hypothetical protein